MPFLADYMKKHGVSDRDVVWPDPEDETRNVHRDAAKWKLSNIAGGKPVGGDPVKVIAPEPYEPQTFKQFVGANKFGMGLSLGPDLLLRGGKGGGSGEAFVYAQAPDGTVVFASGPKGHLDLISLRDNPIFTRRLLDAVVPDWEQMDLQDEVEMRQLVLKKALLGRIGMHPKKRLPLVMFWPGTERIETKLPECLKYLRDKGLVSDDYFVTVGSSAWYTVGEALADSGKVSHMVRKAGGPQDWWQATSPQDKMRQRDAAKQQGRWPYEIMNTEQRNVDHE